jgi:hypothetical protein
MLLSFPQLFLGFFLGRPAIVLDLDYGRRLTDIKNKTPGVEPGVCI